jgi:hypothetical protein
MIILTWKDHPFVKVVWRRLLKTSLPVITADYLTLASLLHYTEPLS